MANCCVVNCSSSYYQLQQWFKLECDVHPGLKKDSCGCDQPFTLHAFPTTRNAEARAVWIKNVNRKDGPKIWQPKPYSRVCSRHFVDGIPSLKNPYPVLHMCHHLKTKAVRKPPTERKPLNVKEKYEVKTVSIDRQEEKVRIPNISSYKHDHTYFFNYKCDCKENCECQGCVNKQNNIECLVRRINELEIENRSLRSDIHTRPNFSLQNVLKNDRNIRLFLGFPNKKVFYKFVQMLSETGKQLRYWKGIKRVVSTKVKSCRASQVPSKRKPGPARKMTITQELAIVFLKLKMNLKHTFLASLFNISVTVCSQIINTWIKFLAHKFKALIYHPTKSEVKRTLPENFMSQVPNVRGIIDCFEVFIETPNSLDVQAQTWSDYKHHNTVKALVDISPTGIIQFISKAWGGRTSDKYIVNNSGYLDTIERGDVILADRGFNIAEELMERGATLFIPPGARGVEQMTPENVKKTKTVATLRIHVERAINRLKWFKILSETIPISLIPLVDEIFIICSAIINLYPPLVK